jgi:hypothetical protein
LIDADILAGSSCRRRCSLTLERAPSYVPDEAALLQERRKHNSHFVIISPNAIYK